MGHFQYLRRHEHQLTRTEGAVIRPVQVIAQREAEGRGVVAGVTQGSVHASEA